MKRTPLLWLFVLLFNGLACGQSPATNPLPKLLVYGVDKLSDCNEEIAAVQQGLADLQYPGNWTIGVVCNQSAWNTLIALARVRTQTGFTNLQKRTTVINAHKFRESRARFRHTLAHELGHVTCQCESEDKAEEVAMRLERALYARKTAPPQTPATPAERADALAAGTPTSGKH